MLDTEFALRDGDNNVKALFRQGQVSIFCWPGLHMQEGGPKLNACSFMFIVLVVY